MIQYRHAPQNDEMLNPTPGVNPSGSRSECKLTLRMLFDSEETPLLRYAFSLTGRRAVAEDIVQEVFLQLHARWDEVESPKSWLMRSVRNRALSHLRDHKREVLGSKTFESASAPHKCKTPEELLLRMEATGVLRQLLQNLDPEDRQLVELKYFQDLRYSDISARTGLSISNVGYRLHHLLKELAQKLLPLGIDGQS